MTPILSMSCLVLSCPLRDQRKPSVPIRIHSSTHSEDIQVLAFHPDKPSVVLSGSADGLLSISNALEDEEDEAVVHVGNWGCSVSRAGWSLAGEEIWSHSDMETLATWDGEVSKKPAHMVVKVTTIECTVCTLRPYA